MGFLTREFTVEDERGQAQAMAAVYVPTNHLYLGRCVHLSRSIACCFRELTVEEGIRIFLTGGMALPGRVHRSPRQIRRCTGQMVDIIGRLSRRRRGSRRPERDAGLQDREAN